MNHLFIPIYKVLTITFLDYTFKIPTYFIMAFIATIVGVLLIWSETQRKHLNKKKSLIFIIAITIGVFVGARLFYVLGPWSWHYDWTLQERFIKLFTSGLVEYGGILGGIFGAYLYTKFNKLNIAKHMDCGAPAIVAALAIARWGCFLANDSCRGSISYLPWAVIRKANHLPIHPTPIYLSIIALVVFIFIWNYRKKIRFDGELMLLTLMLYSVGRFFAEFFRGAYNWELFGVFTYSHFISAAVFIIAFVMYRNRLKTIKKSPNI